MTKILSYASLLFLLINVTIPAISQEMLTGIEVNPAVREQYREHPFLKSSVKGALELPFFDDFSRTEVYPDDEKWADRYAFINTAYPVKPVSLGVATLDVLDHTGALYEHASTWPFIADYLTSRPVNLNYQPEDSIYLSFFYQPQGRGDMPQPHDSLRLEFYSPENESWKIIWSVPGDTLHDFKLINIPVVNHEFLQEGFRFRFSNIASIADNRFNPGAMGNADHWHIDYVYLDRNRSYAETVFRDIAFTKPLASLLNNYEAMPWDQFMAGRLAEMGSVLPVTYRNNDVVIRSVSRQFSIYNVHESRTVHSFSGGIVNVGPGDAQEFNADLAYSYNASNPDSALFRVRAWLVTDDFDYKGNDTVTYYQDFNNYFALDDGTAENGYGLFGGGTENARLAYRFRAYKADSLRSIRIFFNQSLNHASRQYFNLAVWNDDNGKPGELLYSQEGERPVYKEGLNRFYTYHLDSAVYVSQVFYVGIIQTTTDFLNIGFDVNNNSRNRVYYNIHGEWKNSAFEGSLMIRPVLGKPLLKSSGNEQVKRISLKTYPNPAVNIIYVEMEAEIDPGSVTFKLFNRSGQLVYQVSGHVQSIDLSTLPPGIYFLHAESRTAVFEPKKILVTH
ncbi:MAG: T9SS type A sorting domain-containing protein [Bacteroidales bacterium]